MKRLLTIILVILLLPSASLGDSFADMLEKAEKVFDIVPFENDWTRRGDWIQATLWELRKSMIRDVRIFWTGKYRRTEFRTPRPNSSPVFQWFSFLFCNFWYFNFATSTHCGMMDYFITARMISLMHARPAQSCARHTRTELHLMPSRAPIE